MSIILIWLCVVCSQHTELDVHEGRRGHQKWIECSGAWGVSATCDVWATPLQWDARWEEKLLASRVKCPTLQPDFDQTGTGCGPWDSSATFDVWFTPLNARQDKDEKLVSWAKCPSLMSDFYQTSTARDAWGVPSWMFEPPHCNARRARDEKLSPPQE
jgi:hypothetical protein